MSSNARGVTETYIPRERHMALVDALPPMTRLAIKKSARNWDAREAHRYIDLWTLQGMPLEHADAQFAAAIEAADQREVYEWAAKVGYSAHVKARATLMRYDERHY